MSGTTVGVVQGEGGDWRLSFRAVRVHNDHLSIGKAFGASCGVCEEGLGGALARIEEPAKPVDKDEVDPGDRTDKVGDAASSSDYWYGAERKVD